MRKSLNNRWNSMDSELKIYVAHARIPLHLWLRDGFVMIWTGTIPLLPSQRVVQRWLFVWLWAGLVTLCRKQIICNTLPSWMLLQYDAVGLVKNWTLGETSKSQRMFEPGLDICWLEKFFLFLFCSTQSNNLYHIYTDIDTSDSWPVHSSGLLWPSYVDHY